MTLEFISFSDGKEGVARAASFLCTKYLEDSDFEEKDKPFFTEANMGKALTAVGCGGPQPNLLLVYGPVRCHLGFPAWRMRYTEILHMGPLKSMKHGAIVKAIHKFAMVHQNYGTSINECVVCKILYKWLETVGSKHHRTSFLLSFFLMAKLFASSNSPSMAVAVLLLGFLMACLTTTGAQPIGVCYGRNGDNLPPPAQVVALYRSQNIGRMRIYDPAQEVLQALRGSNIELILDVPNPNLQELASDASAAATWVETNVRNFPDVRIKYIAVGNEVSPAKNQQYVSFVFPAMQNIYSAIVAAGLQDQIRVSTAIDTGVVTNSFPPSNGVFTDDARSFLVPIIRFLADNSRAPLLVNIYPYFAILGDQNLKLSYGLFTNSEPEFTDPGNNLVYQNLFDAILDSVYGALEKAGGSGLEIVVSESGWPSAGNREATVDNARTYNQNLINHVGKGSPKTSGRPIETYVFAMFNENRKDPGTEQNFGLFNPNQQPVYPINFSS
ncbi:Glucan endo-1,3-beta-glucosidase [Thalictrum thalictroides]|uniref:Glucan endo-1,3-beta-glucosidase n=1 Tax=Thalictrum thalictroides TaxID=46969 RepID=A0A7J6UY49_THATH|nr:Glucan endo-1,3-beta-glucosidase [Thalictrum thalictroides]